MSGLANSGLESRRPLIAAGMAVVGIVWILLLTAVLDKHWADRLLDRSQTYPFSVQNGMWICFWVAIGELYVRFVSYRQETAQRFAGFLPEDERTVLVAEDLPAIYRKVKASPFRVRCFLPRLIDRCILQFNASKSTDQSASLMNTSMEMFVHEVDLRYNMLRYLTWVIPTLGFIGTVVGIGRSLSTAGVQGASEDPMLLTNITGALAVAFDGTFVALVLASILVLMQNVVQSKEEHALNLAGQYCLDNLINRLYVDDAGGLPKEGA